MEVNTTRLREAIKGVQRLIDSGSVSDEMIATAWILALPPHIAILMVNHIDDLTHRAAIAESEGRDHG